MHNPIAVPLRQQCDRLRHGGCGHCSALLQGDVPTWWRPVARLWTAHRAEGRVQDGRTQPVQHPVQAVLHTTQCTRMCAGTAHACRSWPTSSRQV